jgi:hypothetical protein
MESLFPLYFRKTSDEITRGLSDTENFLQSREFNVLTNPKHIPDRDLKYKMTIVWDLDQTLVSADGIGEENENDPNTKLVIRPHASEVLEVLRRNDKVEFIIWTAGSQSHACRVVGSFPGITFDHIIARDPCWYSEKNPVKNLRLIAGIERPLSSMILVDDRMDIGKLHPENLLVVPPYYPKRYCAANDRTLLYLVNILHRAINMYTKNSVYNPNAIFSSYLFSPLVDKCEEEGLFYYGVKCFESKAELEDRVREFYRRKSTGGMIKEGI